MKSCLIINNREYIPIERLTDLSKLIKIHWYQKTIDIIPIDKLSGKYPDINFLITTYADLSGSNLKKFKKLELIIATTTAVEYIDLNYCEKNGITVCNTPFYTNTTIAEFVFALILNISRQILQVDKAIRSGDFNCFDFCGIELSEKTLGIIGFGNIGSNVANIANGFGMKVVFYNRSKKNSQDSKPVNLRTLLSKSDFVVLCVPLNSASYHLISQNEFDLMKSTAILISFCLY